MEPINDKVKEKAKKFRKMDMNYFFGTDGKGNSAYFYGNNSFRSLIKKCVMSLWFAKNLFLPESKRNCCSFSYSLKRVRCLRTSSFHKNENKRKPRKRQKQCCHSRMAVRLKTTIGIWHIGMAGYGGRSINK